MTHYTAFRCPQDLLDKAKSKAKDDRRSLSNYIITLIEKDVNGQVAPRPVAAKNAARKKARA
jgi:hypothetical protein